MINIKKKSAFPLVLAFFVPICLLLIMYYHAQIFPFGTKSIIIGDLSNQYVALMAYFHNNFFNPSSFFYSYKIALGGNFFPVFTYYLSSPVNLLSLLFPVKDIISFFTINLLFNSGLMSLSMYLFLTKSSWINKNINILQKNNYFITIAFSTSFSLSLFYINYAHCFMWFDAIALLPIVVLGLDRLFYKNKTSLYWISFTVLLFTNYYIGFITTIFLALLTLYFASLSYFECTKNLKRIVYTMFKIFVYTGLSLITSLVIFIPSWIAQKSVYQAPITFNFSPLYKSIDVLATLFPKVGITNGPILYSSILVLLFIPAYFFLKNITQSEKIITGIFILGLLISTWINTFYMVWHAFTMPNGYPSRESFVIVFFFVAIAFRSFKKNFGTDFSAINKGFWICILLLFFFNYFTTYLSSQLSLVIILFLIAYFLNSILILYKKKEKKIFSSIMLLLIICLEIIFTNYHTLKNQSLNSTETTSFSKIVTSTSSIFSKISKSDNNFYRSATTFQINPNDPLLLNYNGVQNYLSQQPTNETNFLSAAGYFQKHSWIRWSTYNNGSTLPMDSLLGIKYVISNTSSSFSNYINKTHSISSFNTTSPNYLNNILFKKNNFTVFKNNSAFPIAFKTTNAVTGLKFSYSSESNPFTIQNRIFKTLSPNNKNVFIKQLVSEQQQKDKVILNITSSRTGNVYLYIPSNMDNNPVNSINISVNHKFVTTAFGKYLYGENGIISLGNFKKNSSISVIISGKNVNSQFSTTPFISIENQHVFEKIRDYSVKNSHIKNLKVNNTNIILNTTTYSKKNTITLTVPYSKGWRASVDGKTTKIHKSLGDLMSLNVKKGNHTIRLDYSVPGLSLSLIISILSLLFLLILTCIIKF